MIFIECSNSKVVQFGCVRQAELKEQVVAEARRMAADEDGEVLPRYLTGRRVLRL